MTFQRPSRKFIEELPSGIREKAEMIYVYPKQSKIPEDVMDRTLQCIRALGTYRYRMKEYHPQIVKVLAPFLNHRNTDYRYFAAEALGKIGHADAATHLHEKLNETDDRAFSGILDALVKIGHPDSKEAIQKRLKKETDERIQKKIQNRIDKLQ